MGALIPADNPAVALHRHSVYRELEVGQKLRHRVSLGTLSGNAVDRDGQRVTYRAGEAAAREAR